MGIDCEVLKNRRKALHYTQGQLAEIVGCRPQTICNIENGRYVPSAPLFLALCMWLDICPYEVTGFRCPLTINDNGDEWVVEYGR